MVCPDDVVTYSCTVHSTSLLRWNIIDGSSTTEISCFGSSRRCLGGGNRIHAIITSISSDPADPDISNITSTLILHGIQTTISIECESPLARLRNDLQVLSLPAPPSGLIINATHSADINQIIIELEWSEPNNADSGLLYAVNCCLDTDLGRCENHSLVRDPKDHIVMDRTINEDMNITISVRTCDRCGRMSQESVHKTVLVKCKSVLSIV